MTCAPCGSCRLTTTPVEAARADDNAAKRRFEWLTEILWKNVWLGRVEFCWLMMKLFCILDFAVGFFYLLSCYLSRCFRKVWRRVYSRVVERAQGWIIVIKSSYSFFIQSRYPFTISGKDFRRPGSNLGQTALARKDGQILQF